MLCLVPPRRLNDEMHGTGVWRAAGGEETQREYVRGELVGERALQRNTNSDE